MNFGKGRISTWCQGAANGAAVYAARTGVLLLPRAPGTMR
jgi:hypothetical protein